MKMEKSEFRNVLITYGMYGDCMLIRTNAPYNKLENWAIDYNIALENGENPLFSKLEEQQYEVEILIDSELVTVSQDDLEEIGYTQTLDLMDYQNYDGCLHNFIENIECNNYENLCDSVYEYKGNKLMEFYDCEDL